MSPKATREEMEQRLADATRTICERDGVKAATVKNIADEAGITRELFYYYFASREEVIDRMIDDYIEDFVDSVRLWSESLDADQQSFAFFAPLYRRALYDNDGNHRAMHDVLLELGRFGKVTTEVIERIVGFYRTTAFHAAYERSHNVPADHAFAFAMYGCFGLLQTHPEITDDELAAICAMALGVEPEGTRP